MTIHFNKAKHLYQKSDKTIYETNDAIGIVKAMVKELKRSMYFVVKNSHASCYERYVMNPEP